MKKIIPTILIAIVVIYTLFIIRVNEPEKRLLQDDVLSLEHQIEIDNLLMQELREEIGRLEKAIGNINQKYDELIKYNELLNRNDNEIPEGLIVSGYKTLNYRGKTYNHLYGLDSGVEVYHDANHLSLVLYDDLAYLLTDLEVNNQLTSEPMISPNQEFLTFIQPYGFELNGNVYLYHIGDKTNEKVIKVDLRRDDTAKIVKWLDDDNLLVIIGYGAGTVSKGGRLYSYNITTEVLSLLIEPETNNQEIVDFVFRKDFVEIEIITWDEAALNYTTDYINLPYTDIPAHVLKEKETSQTITNPIELKDNRLWIQRSDFKNLQLDNEPYDLPYEVDMLMQSSHLSFAYPLAIVDGDLIYNLDDKTSLLSLPSIVEVLELRWGDSVAKEEYIWYGNVNLLPENFTFIDNVVYIKEDNQVLFSVHAFLADTYESIVGIYDTKTTRIEFVESPFMGAVDELTLSSDARYLSYSYNIGGDYLSSFIDIVDTENMKIIKTFNDSELYSGSVNLKDDMHYNFRVSDLEWLDNDLHVKLEVSDDKDTIIDVLDGVLWRDDE